MGLSQIHAEPFEDEAPEIRQQAGHQGWSVDEDGWLRRRRRTGDKEIEPAAFLTPEEVYAPSCAAAIEYDRLVST